LWNPRSSIHDAGWRAVLYAECRDSRSRRGGDRLRPEHLNEWVPVSRRVRPLDAGDWPGILATENSCPRLTGLARKRSSATANRNSQVPSVHCNLQAGNCAATAPRPSRLQAPNSQTETGVRSPRKAACSVHAGGSFEVCQKRPGVDSATYHGL